MASPLIIFSIYKPLTNLFDAALFSICIFALFFIFDRKSSDIQYFMLVTILTVDYFLLITERPDFIMYLWASILVFTINALRHKTVSIQKVLILYFLVISVHFLDISSSYFPNHLAGDVPKNSMFLTGVDPYFQNMISFFGKDSDFIYLNLLDFIGAKVSFFIGNLAGPLNFLAFIYLFIILSLMFYRRFDFHKMETLQILFIFLAVLNLTVLFGFQFQYRYSIFLIAPSIYVLFNLLKSKDSLIIRRFIMLFSLASFVAVNFFTFKKVTAEAAESHSISMQFKELGVSKGLKAAVIYNGGSSLIWSWLLMDSREVHYFLPNEMRDLPNGEYDFEVYSEISLKHSDEMGENDNFFKVGSYYVKRSDRYLILD